MTVKSLINKASAVKKAADAMTENARIAKILYEHNDDPVKPHEDLKKQKAIKDGLGNNVRDYIYDPVDNRFVHKDDLVHESPLPVGMPRELKFGSAAHRRKHPEQYKTINELEDLKKFQNGTYKEPTVGTAAHRKKYPERYGYKYTSKLDQLAYPKAGTAPSEKIVNDYGPVKFDKNGLPNKATPEQFAAAAYRIEKARQMTGSDGRYDKPKPKKINAYADVKIQIPTIDHSLLRDPKQEAREAALEKTRAYAFTKIPDPDSVKGIGAFTNSIARKLRAANSKSDWEKNNRRTYKDNKNE